VASIAPLQGYPDLSVRPEIHTSAPGAMEALMRECSARGADTAALYVIHDGQRSYLRPDHWLGALLSDLRERFGPYDDASAEGYLIQAGAVQPVAHLRASAPPRRARLGFELHRDPETEALENLLKGMEYAILDAARPAFANSTSIAD